MINFSQVASKTLSSCTLMANGQKVSTDVIIAEHPDYVTITQFDFCTSSQGEYAVIGLAEYPGKYCPCGMSITNICRQWVESYEGDIEQANKDLMACGGCRVKLERIRTGKGNQFIKVTVL